MHLSGRGSGIAGKNAATASRVLDDAVEAGLIVVQAMQANSRTHSPSYLQRLSTTSFATSGRMVWFLFRVLERLDTAQASARESSSLAVYERIAESV